MSGGVKDGQLANENTFNEAFMKENGDTETIGKVGLNNSDPDSGAPIVNTQKAINKAFDTVGIANEDDVNAKIYANSNYIADGDNRKQAIEKLDEQLKTTTDAQGTTATELNDHIIDFLAHREVDTFANLTTWASTAPNGAFAFATDTKQSFQVIDGVLEPIGGGSALRFRGTFDADTNTPDIVNDPILDDGDFWIVNVAGNTDVGGITDWEVDDWALFSEGAWYKIDQSNKVTSVNGKTGTVTLDADDIAETDTRYWSLKNNYTALVEPSVLADEQLNYSVGSRWIIPADEAEFVCLDATTGAAVWEQISGGGAGGLSIWDSVKAEKVKLKDWTNIGASVIEVQEVEVASGKSSYKIPMTQNEGAFRTILVPQGAIDANTNGLTFIYKTQVKVRVRVLDSSDDSELLSYELEPVADWTYSKQLFNFEDFTAPSIKLEYTNADITAGDFFLDQIELNSNPNTLGNSVSVNSVSLEGNNGETITANTENIVFNGTGKGWNASTYEYEVQSNGALININGSAFATAPSSDTLKLYKNGGLYKALTTNAQKRVYKFSYEDDKFSKGDILSIRFSVNKTLDSNNTDKQHYLNITETVNTKQVFFEGESEDLDEIWFNTDAAGNVIESKYAGNNGMVVTATSSGQYLWDYSSLGLTVPPTVNGTANLDVLGNRQQAVRFATVTNTSCVIWISNTINATLTSFPLLLSLKKNAPDLKGITTLAVPANAVAQDQEKVLQNNNGISGVIPDLTITGLKIGKSYQIDFINRIQQTSGSTGFVTYTISDGVTSREFINRVDGLQGAKDTKTFSFNLTASSSTITVSQVNTQAATIGGGSTFIQISKRNEGNFIGTMPKNNFILDGVEREVVGESVGGKQVYYRGYIPLSNSVDVIETELTLVDAMSYDDSNGIWIIRIFVGSGSSSSQSQLRYNKNTGVVDINNSGNQTQRGIPQIIKYIKQAP